MLKLSDLFRITIRQHLRQRGIGVLLSISFGVSVYLAVTIMGTDVQNRIIQDVNLIGGVSLIRLTFEEHTMPGTPAQAFFPATVEAVRKSSGVLSASVSMRMEAWENMMLGERRFGLSVLGVDSWFWQTNSVYPVQGRLLTSEDERQRARVCVLGEDAARMLFGDGPAVGRIVTLKVDNYEVVGVAKGVMMRAKSHTCFIPLVTAMDRGFWDAAPNRMFIQMERLEDVAAMAEALPSIVAEHQSPAYLKIEYSREELAKVKLIVVWIRFLLYAGVCASLVLGVLGIWQGTFTAVRERTREIGLKLAMGAEGRDILAQFLAEALFKSVVGGFFGILLGVGVIHLGVIFMGVTVVWSELTRLALGSLAVATLIGMAGGIYPAYCASRMDVVQALRYE